MKTRHSARAVIINRDGLVLLFKFTFRFAGREKVFWVTPGGGLEDGENYEDALKRELSEETGFKLYEVGPWLWTREVLIDGGSASFISYERLFFIRMADPAVSLTDMTPNEFDTLKEYRWWSAEDIMNSGEGFSPPGIGPIVREINAGVLPASPTMIE